VIWSPEEARRVLTQTLGFARAKDVVAHLRGGTSRNTRFAVGEITSTGEADDVELSVRVAFGRRHAQAQTNQFDPSAIRRAVELAEEMAELAPEDPEHQPALGPQKYGKPAAAGYDAATATWGADDRTAAVKNCLAVAGDKKLVAAGFYRTRESFTAVATSAGLSAYDRSTAADLSCTFRTPGGAGSGWAHGTSTRIGDLDAARIARTAADKAQRSDGAQRLDPGEYVAVLEPTAVADLVSSLGASLDARRADEGRSFFSKPGGGNRVGEHLLGPFSLTSDPADPLAPAGRFDGEGLALGKHVWFGEGRLAELVYSRHWAAKQGRPATGSPANLILRGHGRESTLAEIIRATERGVLVTRFWYVRSLERERISLTGLTRDGTFLIEKGEITKPVNNFRFNQEVVAALAGAGRFSAPERVSTSEVSLPIAVPAIQTPRFHFASVSDAV
jgi:predicted Zn-dependent protease